MDLSTLLANVEVHGHTPETVETLMAFRYQIMDLFDRTAAAAGIIALSAAAGVFTAQEAKDATKPFYNAMKTVLS